MTMRAFIITFALFAISCGSDSNSQRSASEFDGSAAYQYLIAQCDFGPRVPNTLAHRQALALIARTFDSLGIAVEKQDFRVKDPYSSDTLRLTNVIGRFNPDHSNRLLFCAHWDSRPRSEMDADSQKQTQPLPGANDGASGTAVLLQLANELAALHVARGVDLVFLDGEDWVNPGIWTTTALAPRNSRVAPMRKCTITALCLIWWETEVSDFSRRNTRFAMRGNWLTRSGLEPRISECRPPSIPAYRNRFMTIICPCWLHPLER